MVPPPRISGRVTAASIEASSVALSFGPGANRNPLPPPKPGNYLYFRGGVLQFGKLTMRDADLELLDSGPDDPFDFYLERYHDQLVAGHVEVTRDKGLVTHVPDYGDLKR